MHDRTPEALTLRAALLESDNRAATLLQQQVGSRRVLNVAKQAGLHNLPDVPSLALGTGLVTPLDMTAAFAVFPNGGFAVRAARHHPRARCRWQHRPHATGGHGTGAVAGSGVPDGLDARRRDRSRHRIARQAPRVHFPVGGKTGTTDDFKDAWFVGFSPSLVVGVWVGFDQPETIGREAYGSRYALPIWADFMQRASRVRPAGAFKRPAGLQDEPLCAITYLKPVDGCPIYTEYFKDGNDIPSRMCTLHQGSIRQWVTRTVQGWLSKAGGRLGVIFR